MSRTQSKHSQLQRLARLCLLFALILRLVTEPALWRTASAACDSLLQSSFLLQLGLASPQKRGGVVTVIKPAPQPQAPKQTLLFSAQEAEQIAVVGSCTYSVDKASLLLSPLQADFSQQGPKILIVHTHASEAYSECDGYHSSHIGKNVVCVGERMAEVFRENGLSVLHDTTLNDAQGYADAYDNMDGILASYLAQYPSIEMIIDVHRDAYDNADGSAAGPTVQLDGEEAARLMLVVGTDEAGQYHPKWKENLSCALKVQAILMQKYPTLCRDLLLRQSRYNQHRTPCSMLVEIGACGNTLGQALKTAEVFADAVSQLIGSSTRQTPGIRMQKPME